MVHLAGTRRIGDAGDLFRWHAPSGDDILLYLPPQGYEVGVDLLDAGQHLAATWRNIRDPLVARAPAPTSRSWSAPTTTHHRPSFRACAATLQEIEKDHAVVISTLGEFLAGP